MKLLLQPAYALSSGRNVKIDSDDAAEILAALQKCLDMSPTGEVLVTNRDEGSRFTPEISEST